LRLLADGETVPSVAAQLEIAESTVRTHAEHMRDKLGASTQAALVAHGFLFGSLS
jgi:two-component system nitrate/nitrite response regulator NarL